MAETLTPAAVLAMLPNIEKQVTFSLSSGSFSLGLTMPLVGAKTISTPTFSTSATVKIQIKDGKIKLDGTLTMAAGAASGMSADFCAAFLGRRRRLQELEAPGAEEPSADEGHRRELQFPDIDITIPTVPCNIPTLTIAVPAFSASLTGTVEVDAAGLAAGYEIELCTVFPTLTSQTFCLGGGHNGVPSTVAGVAGIMSGYTVQSICKKLSDVVPCSLLKISA